MSNKHGSTNFIGKDGMLVEVRRNDVEKANRILKKRMAQEGILKELRKREAYEKPSERKRREKAEARRRWLKKQSMAETEVFDYGG